MTKLNVDALKEYLTAVHERLPAGNPPHGAADDALPRVFEEDDPAAEAPAEAPAEEDRGSQLGAGADQPVGASEAKWQPRSEPPAGPGFSGAQAQEVGFDPNQAPADPQAREGWLQRELDKLRGK